MEIAYTKEQSNAFIEKEISHDLVNVEKQDKPLEVFLDDFKRLILSDGYIYQLDKESGLKWIRTALFGKLNVFDTVSDFLNEKYNRCAILMLCTGARKETKRGVVNYSKMVDYEFEFDFSDREISNGRVIKHEITETLQGKPYIVVLEREINSIHGVRVIYTNELKTKK